MKTTSVEVKTRTGIGSQKSRQIRDTGDVPGVIYGGVAGGKPNREVKHVTVSGEAIENLFRGHGLIIDLTVDGKKEAVAVLKEIQRDAFGDKIMHLDFERLDTTKPVKLTVPLVIKGLPKGITKGGQLRVEMHGIEIEALIAAMPEEIHAKVDDLDLDQVLRVKDLALPAGVKPAGDAEAVVAACRLPVLVAEPAPGTPEATATEPELIGRKPKEGEEGEEGEEGAAPAGDAKAEKKEGGKEKK